PLRRVFPVTNLWQVGGIRRARGYVDQAVVVAGADGWVTNNLNASIRCSMIDALNLWRGGAHKAIAHLLTRLVAVVIGVIKPRGKDDALGRRAQCARAQCGINMGGNLWPWGHRHCTRARKIPDRKAKLICRTLGVVIARWAVGPVASRRRQTCRQINVSAGVSNQ